MIFYAQMNSYLACQPYLYLVFAYAVPSRCIGQTRESAAAAVAAIQVATNKR